MGRKVSMFLVIFILILTLVACSPQVEKIELSKNKKELKIGENETITAEIIPEDVTDVSLTWESSDTDVVTIKDGLIKALGEGTAEVTAKASNGVVSSVCRVTVAKKSAYDEMNEREKDFYNQFVKSGAINVFKDPGSVVIRSVEFKQNDPVDIDMDTHAIIYRDYYLVQISAKNGFGGTGVETYLVYNGSIYTEDNTPFLGVGKLNISNESADIDVSILNKALDEYSEEKGY